MHERFFRGTNFLTKNAPTFSRNFWALFCGSEKYPQNSRQISCKISLPKIKKIHRRASAGAQREDFRQREKSMNHRKKSMSSRTYDPKHDSPLTTAHTRIRYDVAHYAHESAGSIHHHHMMWSLSAKAWRKTPKTITLHDVLEPIKQALLASRDVMMSSRICGAKLQNVFT